MVKEEKNREDKFLIELVSFYTKSLGEAASSVLILKKIQSDFPDKYKDLIELQEDPSALIEISNKMDPELSKILIELMVKASTLSRRVNKLFELSVDEKDKLAEDLRTFSKSMENNIKLLKEKFKASSKKG